MLTNEGWNAFQQNQRLIWSHLQSRGLDAPNESVGVSVVAARDNEESKWGMWNAQPTSASAQQAFIAAHNDTVRQFRAWANQPNAGTLLGGGSSNSLTAGGSGNTAGSGGEGGGGKAALVVGGVVALGVVAFLTRKKWGKWFKKGRKK